MLPTYSCVPGHIAGLKRRRGPHNESAPWGLLILLAASTACLAVTRQRSLRAELDAGAHGRMLSDAEPQLAALREDLESSTAAERTFDAVVHRMYAALPPLPPQTDADLHGGWQLTPAVYDKAVRHRAARVLSWTNPRLAVFPSFLTPAEVGHLVAVAKDHLSRSEVLTANETDAVADARTSYGAWPPGDDVLYAINERIHRLVGVPTPFGEAVYVLNYKRGQRYEAHPDNCVETLGTKPDDVCIDFLKRAGGPDCGPGKGGPSCGDRIATFILYLKAPSKGGHTVFPDADLTVAKLRAAGKEDIQQSGGASWYCDHEEVLGAAPNAGDGVLFWDFEPGTGAGVGSFGGDNDADPAARPVPGAMHSGCAVEEGEKWIATRWIRGAEFM